MPPIENKDSINIQKVKDSLWTSLQNHLDKVYEAERSFNKTLNFTDKYPFDPNLVDTEKLNDFLGQRSNLKDLFIDETEQLNTLIKAIRQKDYKEEDKKYLFLLILGYIGIIESIFEVLNTHLSFFLSVDEELTENMHRFSRLKNFIKLNIKGILPKI